LIGHDQSIPAAVFKPVQLVADAILDCTARGDIVLSGPMSLRRAWIRGHLFAAVAMVPLFLLRGHVLR
jgi:hypothetical protein